MNSKFFVSYEVARLLKEKGYNELTDYIIDEDNFMMDSHYKLNSELSESVYSAPTKAEAVDWLESKGVIIELSVTHNLCHWVFSIYMKGEEDIFTNTDFDFEAFQTRLEAEEAAIIKALELL